MHAAHVFHTGQSPPPPFRLVVSLSFVIVLSPFSHLRCHVASVCNLSHLYRLSTKALLQARTLSRRCTVLPIGLQKLSVSFFF
uniref:Uncharacterized protein n=1 Tax=Rhipicephalus appendiculatus TaxID=34631 RepID=A0A131YCH1_RHIAP